MKRINILLTVLTVSSIYSQILFKDGYKLMQNEQGSSGYFLGNAIVDIHIKDAMIWAGTGYGLNMTGDGGNNWRNFDSDDYQAKGGITAMGFMDDSTFWIAAAYDTFIVSNDNQYLPVGGGLSYTRDFGNSWHYIPQPVDAKNVVEFKPTTTRVQNLTYDIAFLDSTIWIASFAGGLRRSSDMGESWEVVTTDNVPFDAWNYNHRVFSLLVSNEDIWVGTAEGISRSNDGGNIWRRFTAQNQLYPICGNFILALGYQPYTGSIWAACKINDEIDPTEINGVCKTDNGGETWEVVLEDIIAHNFAFYQSNVFIAADKGLLVSGDGGITWYTLPPIRDFQTGEEIIRPECYSAGVSIENGLPRLWVGTTDGLATTIDNGNHWKIIRSFQSTQKKEIADVYAYPSPFSPSRHGYIRFQYDITRSTEVIINIYDFAMDKVATIREFESNPAGNYRDRSTKWDGRNKAGNEVASGIYYYRANIDGKITWGKLVVIR